MDKKHKITFYSDIEDPNRKSHRFSEINQGNEMLLKLAKKGLISKDAVPKHQKEAIILPVVEDVDKDVEGMMRETEQILDESFSSTGSGVFMTKEKNTNLYNSQQRNASELSSQSQVVQTLNKRPHYTPLQHKEEDLFQVQQIQILLEQRHRTEGEDKQILNYLLLFESLKDKFEHLTKQARVKCLNNLKIVSVDQGEYLFRQGDRGDLAYVILLGEVIFMTLNHRKWDHEEEELPKELKEEVEEAEFVTELKHKNQLLVEKILACYEKGKLFGEIALIDQLKQIRSLSAYSKSDCWLLLLNKEAFGILLREKLIKDQQILGSFVYKCIPALEFHYTQSKVQRNVHVVFKQKTFPQGTVIIKEGGVSNQLFIIEKGTAAVQKRVKYELKEGEPLDRKYNLIVKTINEGEIFGEEALCFKNKKNSYSVIVQSADLKVRVIDYFLFAKTYKRVVPDLAKYSYQRQKYIEEREEEWVGSQRKAKRFFFSTFEKGELDCYAESHLRTHLKTAVTSSQMQQKVTKHYLKNSTRENLKKPILQEQSQLQKVEDFKTHMYMKTNRGFRYGLKVETDSSKFADLQTNVIFPGTVAFDFAERARKEKMKQDLLIKQQRPQTPQYSVNPRLQLPKNTDYKEIISNKSMSPQKPPQTSRKSTPRKVVYKPLTVVTQEPDSAFRHGNRRPASELKASSIVSPERQVLNQTTTSKFLKKTAQLEKSKQRPFSSYKRIIPQSKNELPSTTAHTQRSRLSGQNSLLETGSSVQERQSSSLFAVLQGAALFKKRGFASRAGRNMV